VKEKEAILYYFKKERNPMDEANTSPATIDALCVYNNPTGLITPDGLIC